VSEYLSEDAKLICRRLEGVLHGVLQPLQYWMPILKQPDTGAWVSLKDRAFPILIICLRDVIEARGKYFTDIKVLAKKLDVANIYYSIRAFEQVCEMPLSIYSALDEKEQVLMHLTRNRLTHGYLDGATKYPKRIKIVAGGICEVKSYSKIDISKIVPASNSISGVEISTIRRKVFHKLLAYEVEASKLNGMFTEYGGVEKAFSSGVFFFPDD